MYFGCQESGRRGPPSRGNVIIDVIIVVYRARVALILCACWKRVGSLDVTCHVIRCRELSSAIRQSGVMPRLIESLPALPFEARKDVSQVCTQASFCISHVEAIAVVPLRIFSYETEDLPTVIRFIITSSKDSLAYQR